VSDVVWETLRVIVAGVGAVGAWFIVGPLARVLSRLIFQRKLPEGGVTLSRLLGAGIAGVLIYLCLPYFGGGGRGTGGGKGDDQGSGIAGNSGTGRPGSDRAGTDRRGDKAAGDKPGGDKLDIPKEVLPIEILEGARKEGRFYRVQGKEMNLDEVDEFLGTHKGTWNKVYIIRSLDAPGEIEGADRPAGRLKELIVPKHKLLWELKRR